jgi:SAM-dependent methyltransferase
MPVPTQEDTARSYWDGFYAGLTLPPDWTPKVNPLLAGQVGDVPPGTALDLGCGTGGDAVWLAARGWRVTAVDVSDVVLDRARAHAMASGVAERIDWQCHDLTATFPEGTFDLVSAQFLHSPLERPGERDGILRRAATAVAPGGLLVIGAHAGAPTWMHEPPPFAVHMPTTQEVLAALALDPAGWTVRVEQTITRDLPGPDGEPGTRDDSVLLIERTAP